MIIELANLSYTYRGGERPALADVSLRIDAARITGLAGSNGSGKSTMIRIVLGQLQDWTGAYAVDGTAMRDRLGNIPSRYRIGYSPDVPILDETLTGREMLALVGELRGMDSRQIEDEVGMVSKHLLIDDWLEKQQCRAYSAGMRRKVSIALAFLGPVSLAVLDEPVNGLDPLSMAGLRELCRWKRAAGTGTLVSSHILDFIEKTCDDVILLKNGDCRYAGPLDRVREGFPGCADLERVYLSMFGGG